jgi:hypothetical protein
MIGKDMITKEDLEKFKALYKKHFDKELTDQEALDQAIKLLTIVDIVYRPIKKEWLDELEQKDKNKQQS